jgi:hypothetical protein
MDRLSQNFGNTYQYLYMIRHHPWSVNDIVMIGDRLHRANTQIYCFLNCHFSLVMSANKRMRPTQHRSDILLVAREGSGEILVEVPLKPGKCNLDQLDSVAMDLPELGLAPSPDNNHMLAGNPIQITVQDYERLCDEGWLNDENIHFFTRWISRGVPLAESDVVILPSRIYSLIEADRMEQASKHWPMTMGPRKNKTNLDFFGKRMVMLPVNTGRDHWTLAVILNPGRVPIENTTVVSQPAHEPICCMVYLDSLGTRGSGANDKRTMRVYRNIVKWLNYLWEKQGYGGVAPFTVQDGFPRYAPRVPQQENTFDCGVYTCRFAYAMYQLRHKVFTYKDARENFGQAITNHPLFVFGPRHVSSLRADMKILYRRLSIIYMKGELGIQSDIPNGKQFCKEFGDGKDYIGTVIRKCKPCEVRPGKDGDWLIPFYHVRYDDKETEDMSEEELALLLMSHEVTDGRNKKIKIKGSPPPNVQQTEKTKIPIPVENQNHLQTLVSPFSSTKNKTVQAVNILHQHFRFLIAFCLFITAWESC